MQEIQYSFVKVQNGLIVSRRRVAYRVGGPPAVCHLSQWAAVIQ